MTPQPAAWRHAAVLALYTLATVVATWPLVLNLTVAIPGDSFDGWQNYWNQWWIKVALVERLQNPYFTDLLYHPTGVGLYFHTLNPFNGLATLPIQLSAGLLPAYNAVVFLSWVLGGYGMYLLTLWCLDQWTASERSQTAPDRFGMSGHDRFSSHAAAFVAGAIFTFAPFHMAHLLGHMQVMSLEWMPFFILFLLRATQQARKGQSWQRSARMAGLFLVLVGLCDWYYVLYLFLFTGLVVVYTGFLVAGAARSEGRPPAALLRGLIAVTLPALIAGGVFLILLSPILFPMIQDALQYSFMVRPATDLYILSASLMDFLVPNRLHTLFRPESFQWIGNQIAPVSERTISIGYVPLLLALLAAVRDRRRAGLWLVSAVFFLLLALGPAIHPGNITWQDVPADGTVAGWTPYALLNRVVPFMRISRSVSRFAAMVQLSIAVAAGIGLAAIRRPDNRRRMPVGRLVPILCLGLVLAEYWVAPYPISPPDTPDYYARLAREPGTGAVLNLPMNYDRPGYLLYQTVHRKPLTVAYISRDDPRTLTERVPVLQHFRHLGPDVLDVEPASLGLTILHDLGVETVALDRYKMPGGEERTYTTELAQAIFAGQAPVYEDDRLTVFKVPAAIALQPYIELGPQHWGPLQRDGQEIPSRQLGAGPASFQLHHVRAATALQIRYRTEPGAQIHVVWPGSSQPLVTLEPAPAGRVVTLDLASLSEQVSAIGSAARLDSLAFQADPAHSARIEALTLIAP